MSADDVRLSLLKVLTTSKMANLGQQKNFSPVLDDCMPMIEYKISSPFNTLFSEYSTTKMTFLHTYILLALFNWLENILTSIAETIKQIN